MPTISRAAADFFRQLKRLKLTFTTPMTFTTAKYETMPYKRYPLECFSPKTLWSCRHRHPIRDLVSKFCKGKYILHTQISIWNWLFSNNCKYLILSQKTSDKYTHSKVKYCYLMFWQNNTYLEYLIFQLSYPHH